MYSNPNQPSQYNQPIQNNQPIQYNQPNQYNQPIQYNQINQPDQYNQINPSYPAFNQNYQQPAANMIYANGQPVYANPNTLNAGVVMGQPFPQNINGQQNGMRPMVNPQIQQYVQNGTVYPRTKYSTEIYCPGCGYSGMSAVHNEIGNGAWAVCLLGSCVGCCPCSLLPFCIDDCMDQVHQCPNCGVILGSRKFLFDD